MATDATGTPTTSLGIPKYNTAGDIPSGKGFNAAMDYIDDLLEARGAPPGSSGVKVWNNTTKTWDTPAGGDGTKFLRDDGTFQPAVSAELAYVQFTADVSVTATSEAAPTDIVSSGAVVYAAEKICIEFYSWSVQIGTAAFVQFNLWDDATDLGRIGLIRATGNEDTIYTRRYLTPTAASHTYKIRATVNSGAGTVNAGTGGAATDPPGFIRVSRA